MSNQNQGIEYERELVADWKEFGATSAAGTGRGMDLSFIIDNTPINVEVKWLNSWEWNFRFRTGKFSD